MRKHVDFLSQSSQFLDGFIAVFHFGVGVVAFEELADFVELDLETRGGFVEIAQLLDALELAQKLFGSLLEYLFGALTEVRVAFLHLLVDVEAGRTARVLHRYVHHVIFRYIHPPFEVNMRLMRLIACLRVLLLLPLHHRVSIQKHRILNPERVCVLIVKALEPSQFHSSQEFKPNRVDAPWPHCPVFLHLQLTEPVEYYFLRVSGRRHFELFVNVN